MFNNKSILAIIPARAGSKRLPNKNIKEFCGKPLVTWTINAALQSKYIDRLILSSNDEQAIAIAKASGCEVPFVRPNDLASDHASSTDVVRHAINFLNGVYDYIILLQPTSPLRTGEDIDASIELLLKQEALTCVSFCCLSKPISWLYTTDSDGYISKLFKGNSEKQDFYMPNGAIYLSTKEWILNHEHYIYNKTIPYIMPIERSIDIDTQEDWDLASFYFTRSSLK